MIPCAFYGEQSTFLSFQFCVLLYYKLICCTHTSGLGDTNQPVVNMLKKKIVHLLVLSKIGARIEVCATCYVLLECFPSVSFA